MEKDSFQNGINNQGAGPLPAGFYPNYANNQGAAGQLPGGSYQNYANNQGTGQLPGGSYQNYANNQGTGQLPGGSYQNYANNQGTGQLPGGSYQNYANNQGDGQLSGGSYQNYANNQGTMQLEANSYQNDANNEGVGRNPAGSYLNYGNNQAAVQLPGGSYQNDPNQGAGQLAPGSPQNYANNLGAMQLLADSYLNAENNQEIQQPPLGSFQKDANYQGTNLNQTETIKQDLQEQRELYLNEEYTQEEQKTLKDEKPSSALIEKIQQLGVTNVPQPPADSKIHCLTIVGQIEGHLTLPPQNKTTKYEHLIPQLVAIEQNPKIEGVLIILNTVGGDVEAGLAISEMISTISKPTVSIVLGGGHSIGVPIAVSCDYSFIAETATMTIHPIRLTGLVISVPQTFEYLYKMQERVVSFVTKHSGISEEKFKELMFATGNLTQDIGTNVIGAEAVESGLIDQVGGLGHALKKLNQMIELQRGKNERLIQ